MCNIHRKTNIKIEGAEGGRESFSRVDVVEKFLDEKSFVSVRNAETEEVDTPPHLVRVKLVIVIQKKDSAKSGCIQNALHMLRQGYMVTLVDTKHNTTPAFTEARLWELE